MTAPPVPRPAARPAITDVDFARAPFVVIWETTQACDLACLHCRANARPRRDPRELTTAEARALIDTIRAEFGRPLLVLTGGDPLKRPDILELVEHGVRAGLRTALTPSGTPLMTPAVVRQLADRGLARLAVSLDGSTAEIHDRFRGVSGSYDWTVAMLRAARDCGLSTQINTTVAEHNVADFDHIAALIAGLGVALWSVFFVVPVGRARPSDVASAEAFERVFEKMYELSRAAPFDIKSTAAPHYRRYVLQRRAREGRASAASGDGTITPGAAFASGDGIGRAIGVNDARGFVFVSHVGDIYPNGLFPLAAGNVRTHDIARVYRESELFTSLRDPERLKGKCGACEFRSLCGGSRARAYALTGDPYESDPFCAYVPPAYQARVDRGEAEPVDAYFARRVAGWSDGAVRLGTRRSGARPLRRAFPIDASAETSE